MPIRPTLTLGLVLAVGSLAGGVAAAPVCLAAPEQTEDPLADWTKRWDKTLKDAASAYIKVAKKYDEKLEASAAYTRRFALRYTPDDEELRKFLGYNKAPLTDAPDKWRWMRDDIRRDQINAMADLADPKGTKYQSDLTAAHKSVQGWFAALAKKATEAGAAKDANAAAEWPKKAAMAWERVLEVEDIPANKLAEEAHKALNHPKYEGKYVTPFKRQYMKAREERKQAGQKHANLVVKADPVEPDGTFASSGLKGAGAKAPHMTINTTYAKEIATKLAQDTEKGLVDLVEMYGFPDAIKERIGLTKINVVKDELEWKTLLTKGAEWKEAEVQKYIDHHMGGTNTNKGDYAQHSSGGVDSEDFVMALTVNNATRTAQGSARADLGSSVQEGIEQWLLFSMGYDVTKRVLGTALTTWGTFGRYGEAVEPKPGEDKWVELARRLVITDDDIPLQKLPKLKLEENDFGGPQTIKGWAFLQFVFEKDPERAKKFIWNALANGTAQAVATVYPDNEDDPNPEKSMEKLDAEYREWIVKGW
jgi:hypothetical protein